MSPPVSSSKNSPRPKSVAIPDNTQSKPHDLSVISTGYSHSVFSAPCRAKRNLEDMYYGAPTSSTLSPSRSMDSALNSIASTPVSHQPM
jgi:hypothetical protein